MEAGPACGNGFCRSPGADSRAVSPGEKGDHSEMEHSCV